VHAFVDALSFISISGRKSLSLHAPQRLFAGHYFSFGGHPRLSWKPTFPLCWRHCEAKVNFIKKSRTQYDQSENFMKPLVLFIAASSVCLKICVTPASPQVSKWEWDSWVCTFLRCKKKLRDKNYLWLLLAPTPSSTSITYPALKIYSRCRKSSLVCTLISKRKWILILWPREKATNQNTFFMAMQKR
jgi:hypothetical protein